jgi:aspartokinase
VKVVFRFAGGSLDTPLRVKQAAERVRARAQAGDSVAVVVGRSAYRTSRITGRLEQLAAAGAPTAREVARGFAGAEQVTASLLAAELAGSGVEAASLAGREAGITAAGGFSDGRLAALDPGPVTRLVGKGVVPVICGGHGVRRDGEIVSLGPSGADLTAVTLAELMGAACHFVVDRNRLDLGAMGHLVHPGAVERARRAGVPLFIYSYREAPGRSGEGAAKG